MYQGGSIDGVERGDWDADKPCTVCDTSTNTVLGIEGGPEWFLACLERLGMPSSEAKALLIYIAQENSSFGTGKAFSSGKYRVKGHERYLLRICAPCALKAGMMTSTDPTQIPCYMEPAT